MFDPSKLSEISIAGLPLSALLGALLTFLICVIVINVIMKLVAKALGGAKRLNHTMQRFLTSLVRALLWIIAIVIIAGELGIPTASLVAL
jgi:small conductance mechanosensitive channel